MFADKKVKRTTVGIDLVRLLAREGERVFTTQRAREVASRVGLNESYLHEALYHLRRNGWIVNLRRGLHALAGSVPGVVPAHEFEIAMALVEPAAVSHWSALHHHGLTQQVPREVFVSTTTVASPPRVRKTRAGVRSGGFPVVGTIYRFIQVTPERFFGIDEVWIGDARVKITDPERTLLDGLSRPQFCGDFSEVLGGFGKRTADLDLDRIVDHAIRLDGATAKRLGWVLEQHGVAPAQLDRLRAVRVKGYRKLDPTGPRRGPCDRTWMIQVNLPGRMAT